MLKRLTAELRQAHTSFLREEGKEDVSLCPESSNLRSWMAALRGPLDSSYYGGVFLVRVSVPQDYPSSPPKLVFLTPIIHPNIHLRTGEVCLDILKDQWTPVWSIDSACRAVVAMLAAPQEDSPLNCDAGNMLREGDKRGYNAIANMVTKEFATNWADAKLKFPKAPPTI
jgi:peroxin-4